MSLFDAGLLARALRAAGRPDRTPAPAPDPAKAVDVAAALCRRFEGFYSAPYLCPAGVATIGYGATHYLDGRRVTLKDPPISREAADRLLLRMIERTYLPAVQQLCPGLTHPGRLAALIDFTFNLGAGQLRASTLRRKVNAGDWDAVPGELRKWTKGGGRVLRGLVVRREAEAALV
jgi:lysozyme